MATADRFLATPTTNQSPNIAKPLSLNLVICRKHLTKLIMKSRKSTWTYDIIVYWVSIPETRRARKPEFMLTRGQEFLTGPVHTLCSSSWSFPSEDLGQQGLTELLYNKKRLICSLYRTSVQIHNSSLRLELIIPSRGISHTVLSCPLLLSSIWETEGLVLSCIPPSHLLATPLDSGVQWSLLS